MRRTIFIAAWALLRQSSPLLRVHGGAHLRLENGWGPIHPSSAGGDYWSSYNTLYRYLGTWVLPVVHVCNNKYKG